jgi:uncharacterized protein YciI
MSGGLVVIVTASEKFIRYCILLSHTGKPITESLIRAHVAHLKKLDHDGKLELCGPFKDFKGGMVLVRARDYQEAAAIASSDPFVVEGVETFELRTLELSCEENNHLGMG